LSIFLVVYRIELFYFWPVTDRPETGDETMEKITMTEVWLYDINVESEKEFCTCGSVMHQQKSFSHEIHSEEPYYTLEVFKILKCPACDSVSIILYSGLGWEDEDMEDSQRGEPLSHRYSRFILYGPKKRFHDSVPFTISEVVNQAQAVLVNSPRACFILCRAALEEICSDFDIPKEEVSKKGKTRFLSLEERLSKLLEKENRLIDLKPIMDGIKELGNKGAHEDQIILRKQIRNDESQLMLNLVNYLLERIYVDKAREQQANTNLDYLRKQVLSINR